MIPDAFDDTGILQNVDVDPDVKESIFLKVNVDDLMFSFVKPEKLIEYKEKRSENDQNSLRFCIGYDHNYIDLKKDILLNFQTVCKQFEWLNDFKLNITNSILPNLKKILMRTFILTIIIYSLLKIVKLLVARYVNIL